MDLLINSEENIFVTIGRTTPFVVTANELSSLASHWTRITNDKESSVTFDELNYVSSQGKNISLVKNERTRNNQFQTLGLIKGHKFNPSNVAWTRRGIVHAT
jgi:hypothetical protein